MRTCPSAWLMEFLATHVYLPMSDFATFRMSSDMLVWYDQDDSSTLYLGLEGEDEEKENKYEDDYTEDSQMTKRSMDRRVRNDGRVEMNRRRVEE